MNGGQGRFIHLRGQGIVHRHNDVLGRGDGRNGVIAVCQVFDIRVGIFKAAVDFRNGLNINAALSADFFTNVARASGGGVRVNDNSHRKTPNSLIL